MDKLLITYGTRPFAQRVSRQMQKRFDIFLATSEDIPTILQKSFHRIPTGANPTFAHEVLKLALDLDIQYILPLGQGELASFAESKILFEEYGIAILSPSKDELSTVFIAENPSKDVELDLYLNGRSIITGQGNNLGNFSGLGSMVASSSKNILYLSK